MRDAVRACLRSQTRRQRRGAGRRGPATTQSCLRPFRFPLWPDQCSASISARFDGDPDLPLLLSLEHYDEETKRATKASIFRERTIHHQPAGRIRRRRRRKRCSFRLNEKGRVDLDHMAGLLNKPGRGISARLEGHDFSQPANQPMGNRRPISFRQCARKTCRSPMPPVVDRRRASAKTSRR